MTKHQICLDSSQNFYEGLSRAFRDPNLTVIEADLSRIHYIFPWQLTLAACLKACCYGKAELSFQWNKAKKYQNEIASYADRMGLFAGMKEAAVLQEADLRPDFNPENFFQIHPIRPGNEDELKVELENLLARFPSVPKELTEILEEMSENIRIHSGVSPRSGWGYVQAQTTASKLRIAFCDFGVGFYKTFHRENRLNGRSPKEMLELSLDSYSSLPESGAGMKQRGLARLCRYLDEHRGSMEIFSDSLRCRYLMRKKSTSVLGYRTKGLLISIEVPLNR
ncbi:MAG: hypothetical protein EOP07_09300 [Proteobacteria bacterium]|nr:MAG: hypothetical protein EOP07_09300 [Pseudomonadota bacterium]